MKTYVHKKTCRRRFIASLLINPSNWKQPRYPPIREHTNNLVYSYNGILLSNTETWTTDTSNRKDLINITPCDTSLSRNSIYCKSQSMVEKIKTVTVSGATEDRGWVGRSMRKLSGVIVMFYTLQGFEIHRRMCSLKFSKCTFKIYAFCYA